MGYFTYRIFKGISFVRLHQKVLANLALYEPGALSDRFAVTLYDGDGCAAIFMGYLAREEEILRPIGFEFGCLWMDVAYLDGDAWQITMYEGAEHRCGHNVNPWAFEERVRYDPDQIEFRINRICEAWPDHAERMRRYLLP